MNGPDVPEPVETRICSCCKHERPAKEFSWVNDRYGIPWKKVCWEGDCLSKTRAEIAPFEFDPDEAGESLEPDDY